MKKITLGLISCLLLSGVAMAQKNATPRIVKIDTESLSLVMGVNKEGYLLFHHFGPKIEDATPFLKKGEYRREPTYEMAYLSSGGRNIREPALRVTHANGDINTELVYVSHKETAAGADGARTLEILLRDKVNPLEVTLIVKAWQKENVISEHVVIRNAGDKPVTLHNYYSAYMPLKANKYYLNHFYGAWAREMMLAETQLTAGIKTVESKRGARATRCENPSFLLALDTPLAENSGNVIGGALAWSGNWKLNFEIDEFAILNISAGISPFASDYTLPAGATFETPEMIFTYSTAGAGGVSRNLHDWARNHRVYDAQTIRPTLLNSWEGAYFTFDEKTLTDMIDDAAGMGLEMFVLDDGWFGNKYPRDNNKTALGDWQVNKKKLPRGIGYLADYAVSKGLKFGIWIEPEMVSPKSELAEKHPEWIVKGKGREIPTMRYQWLLDLTNPEVQDFVFSVFDETMKLSPNISYIKWDANRHVENAGSAYLDDDKQSHFWVEYTRGLYKVYERVRAKYPNVIVQACASGGGRVDYGALKYHQEVWTSDNTDAITRVRIQYGTNLIYPSLVTGSHVSQVPNHQTNNVTPLKFRFDLAMTGRFGMELQPKDMNEADKEFAKMAIANYKNIRDIVMQGDLYRINSPYDNSGLYSLMYVSKDKTRAVMSAFCIDYRNIMPTFKLNGLDPAKRYKVTELNEKKSKFWANGKTFNGEFLINGGLNPRLMKNLQSMVLLLEETK
ncbi:alpha-galactosidase [Ereboglobus sp. PH5-10]|uniref:alpha-galactosidase n=1 Tax=Ereboglobus sp. PH5-10 TaxID=2940629 RepID=UPI0024072676|nr:alpha-galactosidase [Ereboglobus sp. PH5-10]MDF9826111.1 alpha-galactosidase [Ereboglobus sp. PH5-10]